MPDPRFSHTVRPCPGTTTSSKIFRSRLFRLEETPASPNRSSVTGPYRPPRVADDETVGEELHLHLGASAVRPQVPVHHRVDQDLAHRLYGELRSHARQPCSVHHEATAHGPQDVLQAVADHQGSRAREDAVVGEALSAGQLRPGRRRVLDERHVQLREPALRVARHGHQPGQGRVPPRGVVDHHARLQEDLLVRQAREGSRAGRSESLAVGGDELTVQVLRGCVLHRVVVVARLPPRRLQGVHLGGGERVVAVARAPERALDHSPRPEEARLLLGGAARGPPPPRRRPPRPRAPR